MRNILKDKRGIILAGIIAIVFIVLSSIVWLCGALIVSLTYDELSPIMAECDERVPIIAEHVLTAYGVSIVFIDVLLLVWWGLSAQKVSSIDEPGGYT